jgi:hypothetical protein
MRTPRQPFSWHGDDENPIAPEDLLGVVGPKIIDEAEAVVLQAQDAIGRQDTDPFMTLPEQAQGSVERRISRLQRPVSRRALIATLLLACVLAFAHGWSVGSSGALAASSNCDSDHCSSRGVSSEWRKE